MPKYSQVSLLSVAAGLVTFKTLSIEKPTGPTNNFTSPSAISVESTTPKLVIFDEYVLPLWSLYETATRYSPSGSWLPKDRSQIFLPGKI